MNKLLLIVVVVVCLSISSLAQFSCQSYNNAFNRSNGNTSLDTTLHINGGRHWQSVLISNTCRYRTQGQRCLPTAQSYVTGNHGDDDTNTIVNNQGQLDGHNHWLGFNNYNLTKTMMGDGDDEPTTWATAAVSANDCYYQDQGCKPIGIGFDSLGRPLWTLHEGTTGTPVWLHYYMEPPFTCPYEQLTTYSPIVIDLNATNFPAGSFTNVQNGVQFDYEGTGTPVQTSWTAQGRNIGFLWLDRTGLVDPDGSDNYDPCTITVNGFLADTTTCNGKVDSARELFGNLTRQDETPVLKTPGSSYPANGFEALRVFDFNNDGQIDINDVDSNGVHPFNLLKVWVDTCHCGDSTQGMNYSMADLGIRAISLSYTSSSRVDEFGNQFRYQGSIVPSSPTAAAAQIYDVFFQQ